MYDELSVRLLLAPRERGSTIAHWSPHNRRGAQVPILPEYRRSFLLKFSAPIGYLQGPGSAGARTSSRRNIHANIVAGVIVFPGATQSILGVVLVASFDDTRYPRTTMCTHLTQWSLEIASLTHLSGSILGLSNCPSSRPPRRPGQNKPTRPYGWASIPTHPIRSRLPASSAVGKLR